MFKTLREDIRAIRERDPAARNSFEVFVLYSGFHALVIHRIAHFFHKLKLCFIARFISQLNRFLTGIEIHPGAQIGRGFFIDHGAGVVIGETTIIGEGCTIYQGVTLGGTGKESGKRHPTIGNNVMIGSGAKVLGPFTVGDNSKIAANAVVLNEIPPNSTAVGVPARVVKRGGIRECDLDQIHIPDPLAQEICLMKSQIKKLEAEINDIKNKDANR